MKTKPHKTAMETLSGRLNKACHTGDIEIVRVDGDRDGIGLPDSIILRRGNKNVKYTQCLTWSDSNKPKLP